MILKKHNPNTQIWHPVLHHQGAWIYRQINDTFKTNSWKVERTKAIGKSLPNNDIVSDQEVVNRIDYDFLSNQFIRDNNNYNTFEDESIVDDKTVSKIDLNDDINFFNNDIKEDSRITKKRRKKNKV